jgi:hypothetical protein
MVPPDQLIMPFVQQLESSFRENFEQERARADRAEAKLNLRTIDLENERRVNRSLEARTRQVVRYQTAFLFAQSQTRKPCPLANLMVEISDRRWSYRLLTVTTSKG